MSIFNQFKEIFGRGYSWDYRISRLNELFRNFDLNKKNKDWKKLKLTPEEALVFSALENPKFTFRTFQGIVNGTRLPENLVFDVLFKYRDTYIVRVFSIEKKEFIFALKSRVSRN